MSFIHVSTLIHGHRGLDTERKRERERERDRERERERDVLGNKPRLLQICHPYPKGPSIYMALPFGLNVFCMDTLGTEALLPGCLEPLKAAEVAEYAV